VVYLPPHVCLTCEDANSTEWDFGTGSGKDSLDRKMFAE
jgi:hypothetical protein